MSGNCSTAAEAESLTQASGVYDRIRADILGGSLQPGAKLGMRLLTQRYATGQTPIREALNRLTAEQLVEVRDQRGFSVAGISAQEMADLVRTRCAVEGMAIRQSIAAAAPDWVERLVLAHERMVRAGQEAREYGPEWERLHRAFHYMLIAQCGSRTLIHFCGHLTDLVYRYRQFFAKPGWEREVGPDHQAILDAVLARHADRAVTLLERHYYRLIEGVA